MTLTDELIRLANDLGGNVEYSRAGGGNASVKIDDILYIKPSGVPLATLQAEDLIPLDRQVLLDALHSTTQVEGDPVQVAAQAAQLRDVQGRRPSVEILFHALIPDPLVIHLHPRTTNALTCNEHGRELTQEILGDDAVWVDYYDPGLPLARAIDAARQAFSERTGTPPPSITLLGNHGVIISGQTYEQVKATTLTLTERIRTAINKAAVTSPPVLNADDISHVGEWLAQHTGTDTFVFTTHKEVVECCGLDSGPVSSGPLIPDQIVYAASFPLVVHPPLSDEAAASSLARYREVHGRDPIIMVIPHACILAVGATEQAARNALDTFVDALQVSRDANILGRVRTLNEAERHFIETWEAESYRQAVAAKNPMPA